MRARIWRWLMGAAAWEGAVCHLKGELWRLARNGGNPSKVVTELARLGVEKREAAAVLERGQRLPTDPCQTVVFVDGLLIGYTTNWRVSANPGTPNAFIVEIELRP